MRTCAIVNFCQQIDNSLSTAHKEILDGGSIGATLKKHNFKLNKTPLYFGEVALPKIAKANMYVANELAAVHIYNLNVSSSEHEKSMEYCTITEIHSPRYLTIKSLENLYPKDSMGCKEKNDQVNLHLDKINQIDSILGSKLLNKPAPK